MCIHDRAEPTSSTNSIWNMYAIIHSIAIDTRGLNYRSHFCTVTKILVRVIFILTIFIDDHHFDNNMYIHIYMYFFLLHPLSVCWIHPFEHLIHHVS